MGRRLAPPFPADHLLEPLHPLPPGTVLTPQEGQPIIVHVDSVRHQRNRHEFRDPPEPLIRLIVSEGEIYHARHVELGPCTLAEAYHESLPRRTQAVCVLKTMAPILIVE